MILIKNVLVATDFSEPSDTALRYGRNIARAFGAALHVVHVVDDLAAHGTPLNLPAVNYGPLQIELDAAARDALNRILTDDDRKNLHAEAVVIAAASPASAILQYARDNSVDLVIAGTQGRTGVARFLLGSVAEQIVRSAPCPVLTVRETEREFVRPDALETVTHTPQPPAH
jgi:nucleotide-binding universal stress UspA family protein